MLPEVFDPYYLSMALSHGSPLRRPINKALLDYLQSEHWMELFMRYLP